MGKVPLNDPASKVRLAGWLKQPGMLGFRISFRHSGTHSFLDDGTADWFWADCERYDIPVMIFAPFAVAKIGEIAAAPSRPARDRRSHGSQYAVERQRFGARGRCPAPVRAPAERRRESFPVCPATSTKPIRFPRCIGKFAVSSRPSAHNGFFGAPILSQSPCSYRRAVTLFTEELDFLSAADKEWIMGRALAEWLNWPLENPRAHWRTIPAR